MTEQDAIKLLEECAQLDTECAHSSGDEVLCTFLRELGYGAIVDAWEKLDKWYA